MRIAFLTPEYVEQGNTSGGLANFVYRMAQSCARLGHDVEVFSVRRDRSEQIIVDVENVRATLLKNPGCALWEKAILLPGLLIPRLSLINCLYMRRVGRAICDALMTVHTKQPFDIVHTSDLGAPGYWLPARPAFRVVLRSSSRHVDSREIRGIGKSISSTIEWQREQSVFRKADVVYAPSHYTASRFEQELGVPVHVVRPPFFLDAEPERMSNVEIPERYLLHVGRLGRIKGSDILAEALTLAWQQEPELKMVWIGDEEERSLMHRLHQRWGETSAKKVIHLGTIAKPHLYEMMQNAIATIAPSRLDNLPNVVLESLALKTPVIGTDGASINEIVEHGRSGELVPMESSTALAESLVRAWRGVPPFDGQSFQKPVIFEEMQPPVAAQRMLDLVLQ